MELGFAPLWSASILLQVEFWLQIMKNPPWITYGLWSSAIFGKNVTSFKNHFESSFDADHNGTIPNFISHSHTKTQHSVTLTLDTQSRNDWAMYYTRYLELGMRYEAGICTIVISMNGAFKWCPFCYKLNFDPKSWKTMVAFGRVRFFGKNVTDIKNHL